MEYRSKGKIIRGVGGRYTIDLSPTTGARAPLDGKQVTCYARGSFRHSGETPLPGDDVLVRYDADEVPSEGNSDGRPGGRPDGAGHACCADDTSDANGINDTNGAGVADATHGARGVDSKNTSRADDGEVSGVGNLCIERILPRRNCLIRPPMANLDVLFVSMAAARPEPLLSTVDKLISIAEYHHIEPVIIVGKSDLAPEVAQKLTAIYTHAGFTVFAVSCERGEGIDAVRDYIKERLRGGRDACGGIGAFAGASGVGKSSLLNALFPACARQTGEISRKNERGKNTTREVTLLPLSRLFGECAGGAGTFEDGVLAANDNPAADDSLVTNDAPSADGYLADTPGFTLLDFTRFDFFGVEDLPATMRDFAPYLGHCRYTDCTHTKEEDCAVRAALAAGEIEQSRYDSFLAMYADLKDKRPWSKPPTRR